MRPSFRYCAGWACAAVAATTVSWVAIRDVVATAAVGDPVPAGAVVAFAGDSRDAGRPTGRAEAQVPSPDPTSVPSVSLSPRERIRPSAGSADPTTAPTGRPGATREPDRRPGRPEGSGTAAGDYKGYVLTGGQVVVQMWPDEAALVAAVPASGYETQTWKTDSWFRVDFVAGERRSSIIVAWNGTPPVATITEF